MTINTYLSLQKTMLAYRFLHRRCKKQLFTPKFFKIFTHEKKNQIFQIMLQTEKGGKKLIWDGFSYNLKEKNENDMK
jgi:hypothetical protein